ncbi:MAG: hypothetical protein J1E40_03490 [Oscillospiraceae bacterium]|nr:hypothetical protein [Oscillospiraceae bacterium]
MEIFLYFLIFDMPTVALIWFIVSLVFFLKCPAEKTDRKKNLKTMLIISSAVLGVMILAIIGLIVILSLAVMNM